MDEHRVTTALDTHIGVPLKPAGRVEVLGRLSGRRRVWTVELKLELGRRTEENLRQGCIAAVTPQRLQTCGFLPAQL
jgi:hypothetical protein